MGGPTAIRVARWSDGVRSTWRAGDLLADAVEVGYRMYRAAALAHGVPDPGC